MLEHLVSLPPDPILGLSAAYQADGRPIKMDLGVGVYRNEAGETPIMAAVREAESRLLRGQRTKVYLPPAGTHRFQHLMQILILGDSHPALEADRCRSIQTPGGCGALRLGAEFVRSTAPSAKVWVSSPTWSNHLPLLGSAGLELREYPYYDGRRGSVDFDGMISALEAVAVNDLVLLHGCCHNPSGADLTLTQWRQVGELLHERGAIAFVDLAYLGLGDGLEADAAGVRELASLLPELLVATSCSKNFGLYRERIGALSVVASRPQAAVAAQTHLCHIARGIYSMPPAHGAAIVETILGDEALTGIWYRELAGMRERINRLRREFVEAMKGASADRDFEFIAHQRGLFSILDIDAATVVRLRDESAIYMAQSSRINIAGINGANLDYLAQSLATLL